MDKEPEHLFQILFIRIRGIFGVKIQMKIVISQSLRLHFSSVLVRFICTCGPTSGLGFLLLRSFLNSAALYVATGYREQVSVGRQSNSKCSQNYPPLLLEGDMGPGRRVVLEHKEFMYYFVVDLLLGIWIGMSNKVSKFNSIYPEKFSFC